MTVLMQRLSALIREEVKPEKLEDQITHCEQEARMVLPGIQALFGFQLIAGFNANFKTLLPQGLQDLHLAALVCVAVSVMCVLTPAAYHRQGEPGQISRLLARVASLFLTLGMVPMMIGIVLDVYVVSFLVSSDRSVALWIAASLFIGFVLLWFVFPRALRRIYHPPLARH